MEFMQVKGHFSPEAFPSLPQAELVTLPIMLNYNEVYKCFCPMSPGSPQRQQLHLRRLDTPRGYMALIMFSVCTEWMN